MTETSITVAALAALPHGVVLFDREGRLSLLNPAAARILAVDREACRGLDYAACIERFILPDPIGPERQWAGRYPAHYLVQALELTPQARAAGLSTGLLLMEPPQEFTLLERLEQSLNYDMRSPLAAIISSADILRRGVAGPLPERADEFLNHIAGCGTLLLRVVEQNRRLIRTKEGLKLIEFCNPVGIVAMRHGSPFLDIPPVPA